MKRKIYMLAMTAAAAALLLNGCKGASGNTTEGTTAAQETVTENATDPSMEVGNAPDGSSGATKNEGSASDGKEAPDGQQPPSGKPGGGPGGSSSQPESYSAVKDETADTTLTGSITSTGTDENAVYIHEGAAVTVKNADIQRTSADSTGGDQSSFYGVGAAVLTTEGTAYISDSTITTDAKGGAGVFAYGSGTAYVSGTKITTAKDTSGGLHAAGGGTLYGWNNTVNTSGESSAAIRSDRGGGKMVIDGGSYTSNGTGSPAIYSTADIAVHDATLTANGSEAICIEGDNQIRLFDCDLTGNMADLSQNGLTWNVILYQSMSGDSEEGNSVFEMDGGSLTGKNGGMFYTTNTESSFVLRNVAITYPEENDFFLRATGNANERGWGTSGQNGADCSFTGISQKMEGNILWDSISKLDFYMTEGSSLTGTVLQDESNAGSGGDGYCSLYISKDSQWTVTGDATLTNLYTEGTIIGADGKAVTIVDANGKTLEQGSSQYTITVTGSYEKTVDLSGAGSIDSWSDYAVTKPAEL